MLGLLVRFCKCSVGAPVSVTLRHTLIMSRLSRLPGLSGPGPGPGAGGNRQPTLSHSTLPCPTLPYPTLPSRSLAWRLRQQITSRPSRRWTAIWSLSVACCQCCLPPPLLPPPHSAIPPQLVHVLGRSAGDGHGARCGLLANPSNMARAGPFNPRVWRVPTS